MLVRYHVLTNIRSMNMLVRYHVLTNIRSMNMNMLACRYHVLTNIRSMNMLVRYHVLTNNIRIMNIPANFLKSSGNFCMPIFLTTNFAAYLLNHIKLMILPKLFAFQNLIK